MKPVSPWLEVGSPTLGPGSMPEPLWVEGEPLLVEGEPLWVVGEGLRRFEPPSVLDKLVWLGLAILEVF